MSTTAGWLADTTRKPTVEQMRLTGLPLLTVDRSALIRPDEVAVNKLWPPQRLWDRQRRLQQYQRAWEGDWTEWVGDEAALGPRVNICRRFPSTIAELLCSAPPRLDGLPAGVTDDVRDDLTMQFHNATLEALDQVGRTGRGWIMAVIVGGRLVVTSPPPGTVMAVVGGDVLVAGHSIDPNQEVPVPEIVDMHLVRTNGTVEKYMGRTSGYWTGPGQTNLGSQSSLSALVGPLSVSRGAIWPINGTPRASDGWGVSLLDDLLPLAVAHSVRLGSMMRILDAHEHPMVAWWANSQDLTVLIDDDVPHSDQDEAAAMAANLWRQHDVMWVPTAVQRVEYLTWDGNLGDSAEVLNRLEAAMRLMSSVPAILESAGGVPSGVALRRLLLGLYSRTRQLQLVTAHVLRRAVRLMWPEADVLWPHVLDVMSDAEEDEDHDEMSDDDGTDGAPEMNDE